MGRRRDCAGDSKTGLESPLPVRIITDDEHYSIVIEEQVLHAEQSIVIATANVKDLHVKRRGRYRSILVEFQALVERGVSIRILHGAPPSRPFLESLEKRPGLSTNSRFEMMYCPRTHFKMVLVDGGFLYVGSANFTGAGLGVKNRTRRNHEAGIVTRQPDLIRTYADYFETIWSTSLCEGCGRRDVCY